MTNRTEMAILIANYTGAQFVIACSNATSAYNVRDLERMECFSAKCLSSFFIYNMSQTRDKRESEGWKPNGA